MSDIRVNCLLLTLRQLLLNNELTRIKVKKSSAKSFPGCEEVSNDKIDNNSAKSKEGSNNFLVLETRKM
jgi:hypothetical protein